MVATDGERIAANTTELRGLRGDVQELKESQGAVVDRLSKVEQCLGRIAALREQERRNTKHRWDTFLVALRAIAVIFAGGSLLVTAAIAFAAFYFHK